MKKLCLVILLFLIVKLSFTQTVDFDLIKYKGLNFFSTKSEIIKKLGSPIKIFEPNNECGFLSSDEQGQDYFTLDYDKIKFTGNETKKYLLEQIDFENDNSIVLNYGKFKLTCETDIAELVEIFGMELTKYLENNLNGGIAIYSEKADDGVNIEIKNGKLNRFEYWSPC